MTLVATSLLMLMGCQSMGTQAPAAGQSNDAKPAVSAKKEGNPGKPELSQGFTCCNFHN